MSDLRYYSPEELSEFLIAIDERLSSREKLLVIGGGAIALGYGVGLTQDIDTFYSVSPAIERAAERARKDLGFRVPLRRSPVSDVPYESEDRLIRVVPETRKLIVNVLEKHDVAISKIMRSYDKDLTALERLHEASPLDADLLLSRYIAEVRKSSAIGSVDSNDRKMRWAIRDLFGEDAGEHAREVLGIPPIK